MLLMAKKITKDINGDQKIDQWGVSFENSATTTVGLMYAFGGRVIDAQCSKSMLNDARSIRGMEWVVDLVNTHRVAENPTTGSGQSRYQEKRAAIYIGNPVRIPTFRQMNKFKWDAALMPKGPGGQGSTLSSDGYVMSSQSKNKQGAWELIKFMTSASLQMKFAQAGGYVPSRKSLLKADLFTKTTVPPFNTDCYELSNEIAIPIPRTPAWAEAARYSTEAWASAYNGKKSVAQAHKYASDQIDKILGRYNH
jgi:multiple sugar transport system substrate-binding protein